MTDPERPDPTHHEPVPGDSTDEELTWSPQESPLVPPDWMVGSIPPSAIPPVPPAAAAPLPSAEAAPSYPYAVQPAAPTSGSVYPYVASPDYGAPAPAPASRPPLGLGWLWWLAGGCALLLLCCMCVVLLSLVSVAVGLGPSRSNPVPTAPTATPRPPASANPSDAPVTEVAPARPNNGPIGQAATDFTVTTLDGQTMKLSDFRGHPVVLNFWASWCGPCREEMPLLAKTYEEHKDSGLIVLAVNMQESAATARRYAEQNKLPFTIALDEMGAISGQYRVRSLPTTYFIDAEGVIQSWQTGTLSKMLLDRHLERIR